MNKISEEKRKIAKNRSKFDTHKKMHFHVVAIIAVVKAAIGLAAADSTDYNHVNTDGSFAFGYWSTFGY